MRLAYRRRVEFYVCASDGFDRIVERKMSRLLEEIFVGFLFIAIVLVIGHVLDGRNARRKDRE